MPVAPPRPRPARPPRLRAGARSSRLLRQLGVGLLAWSLSLGPAWPQRHALPALGEGEGLSLSAERQLGDRIVRELYRDPDFIEDALLDEHVQSLWAPLVQAAAARGELSDDLRERFAWRILLSRDRSVNAFALPGGYLGVHLGLIAVVSNRDELASVLAHELSHVTQRHIARSIEAQGRMTPLLIGSLILGALAASKSPQATQALIVGGQAASLQSQLSYSRDMEREADRVGFGVLSQAGYDPQGFVGMFAKLQQAAGLNDSGAFPYLRSHPLTTERIADMQSRLPLGGRASPPAPDLLQALASARARVLSQSQVDQLRAWTQMPSSLPAQASLAQRAGALYAAALAWQRLREPEAAQRSWLALQALQAQQPPGQGHAQAERWVRLLGLELQAARAEHAQVVQALLATGPRNRLARPELVALSQSLLHLSGHPAVSVAIEQLRLQVQTPDPQAWALLAGLLAAQGQGLAALRAEGEAQLARLDLPGALDRFRAAQEAARRRPLQPGEHIEVSIVDTRVRDIAAQLREQAQER